MRLARHAALAGILFALPLPAPAQEDGGGMIQRFLQDKLSASGREVTIRGFEGLLTGAARLGEMTIADDEGVWLILRDAELDWSRAALLRGNLNVANLSAGELILERLPAPPPADDTVLPETPDPEARGFALPELPISVRIDNFAIERAELGETVLGQEAVLGVKGAVQLAGGEGQVTLDTRRLDGPSDQILLEGGFVNETGILSLDLSLTEEPGGLVGALINLPGSPSIDLAVTGEGPLTDFTTDIGLRTDGEDRVAGRVSLTGDDAGNTGFSADIGGDITPLLPEEFHEFFGDDVRLTARGSGSSATGFDLPEFALTTEALDLSGNLSLGPDNLPTAFEITGRMGREDNAPLRLPVSGPATYLESVTLNAGFDASQSDRWALQAEVAGLDTDTADLRELSLDGTGRITTEGGATVTADLLFDLAGLAMADPALSEAIGEALSGGAALSWQQGGALDISRFYADGSDFGTDVTGDIRIAERSVKISGAGRVWADDLARYSALAGRPLTGAVSARLSGQGDPLGGEFAVTADLSGDGLTIAEETADRLLDGPVTIATAIRRDTEGTNLDRFELRSRGIEADAQGRVGSGASDLEFDARLTDVSLVLPDYQGSLALRGTAREDAPGDWQVGLDLDGPYDLAGAVAGRVKPGESDVTLDLSLPDIAPLVPGHEGPVTINGRAAEADEGRWNVDLDLGGPYDLAAAIEGLVAPGESDIALDLTLPDIAPLVPGHSGALALTGRAAETDAGGWSFALDGSGPYASSLDLDGVVGGGPGEVTFAAALPDIAPLAPGFTGALKAEGRASDAGDGLWNVEFDASGPYDAVARIDGVAGGGRSDLDLDISVPDLSPIVPQVTGPVRVAGNAAELGDGRWQIDVDASGPDAAMAQVEGAVGATGTDVTLVVDVPRVAAFAPGIPGALNATADAAQQENGAWLVSLDASGPYAATVAADATYLAGSSEISLDASLPDIGVLVPAYSGAVTLAATANEAAAGAWNVALESGLPYGGTATVAGRVEPQATEVDLKIDLPSIAPFAPGLTGGFAASGTVSQASGAYVVSLDTSGPQSASSAISGTVAEDFSTVSLKVNGTAPLGLANAALSPNALRGSAAFDISVDGAPALDAVSGTVTIGGGELILPDLRQSLTGIAVQLGINGSNLQLDASANGQDGGRIGASGTLQLTGGLNANLETNLTGFVLKDPTLFSTTLDGGVSVVGPLAGGAQIDGRIRIGRTEIRIPDGGLGFGGAVPNMRHVNEPGAVFLTRQRAGLVETERDSGGGSGGSGPSYGLNVVVNAPEQIFIRGRGLDTELGGAMRVTGTTANPNPVGEIEVIRGRLDILGKRLDVTEGKVSLAGGLQPYIDLTATSESDDFEFLARIFGPVDDPEFDLSSVPDLPQDEVLAQFLFGKSVTDLSALQAVQLASAVATLTGRGGPGLLGGVRDRLGLDDLDLATTDSGGTEVRAGRYLTDNIYTEFVADSEGETELDLNIDIHKNVTIKGTADSTGDSSIGIYFERDY